MENILDRTASAEANTAPPPLLPLNWRFLVAVAFGVPAFLVLVRHPITLDNWEGLARNYAVDVVVTLAIGSLLVFAYAIPLPRLLPRVTSRAARVVIHVGTVTVAVRAGLFAAHPAVQLFCTPGELEDPIHAKVMALVAAGLVVATALYFEQQKAHTRQIEKLAEEAQQAALRAQLEALQARTNPHFLFNSLNTVASLIPTDPACAEATLERLSGLFRYSLDGARRTRVRFADELAATMDYLDVEALRLGERLSWSLDIEEGLDDVRLPPLTLQPLVENAVLHAVAPRRGGGHVLISAHAADTLMIVAVEDDGPGPGSHSTSNGTGTALADLGRRLSVAFGDAASVSSSSATGGGYRIEVRIPRDGAT